MRPLFGPQASRSAASVGRGRFRVAVYAESRVSPPTPNSRKIDALIRLEVACRLALDALPALADDTEQMLRDHVQALCDVSERFDRIKPGWRDSAQRIL